MFQIAKVSRLLLLLVLTLPAPARALPARLVLAMDGLAYRDVLALQKGITLTNFWGRKIVRRAFTAEEGYFPVSRMVSTFPSLSDIAWTDILGDRPLPGYQRIYFSDAANAEIFTSGIATTMEYERQMDWQEQSSFLRGLGYIFPLHAYEREMRHMTEHFWQAAGMQTNYYAYIRASDDAQHLDRNIVTMLCELDRELQDLRARYRAREGRELQIVMLSDHGHNHAGRGHRLQLRSFLVRAGYHPAKSIATDKDVVLPDGGIEDWAEIHNAPNETEKLTQLLCDLKGVDILAAVLPGETNRFLVMNSKSERATVDWRAEDNSFRYSAEIGDPLNYRATIEFLKQRNELDAEGFASAEAWLDVTVTNHYPLALERIVRGFARNVLNPATILISLDNRYVNDEWLTDAGSRLVTCRSTHGALDDLNSDGIVLSNFQPTHDTSSDRVAAQFDNFPAVKNYRAFENGAELVTKRGQIFAPIVRDSFDHEVNLLPDDGVYLHVWARAVTNENNDTSVKVTIKKASRFSIFEHSQTVVLSQAIPFSGGAASDRIFALPVELKLLPKSKYVISSTLFRLAFHTDENGKPVAY